jgi:hypothetical protein
VLECDLEAGEARLAFTSALDLRLIDEGGAHRPLPFRAADGKDKDSSST